MKVIIVNALIWAAFMLVVSYFYMDGGYYKFFFAIWTIGFTLMNGFLYNRELKKRENAD